MQFRSFALLLLIVILTAFSTAFAYSGFPYWVEHDENGNPLDNIWVKVNLTANEPLEFYVYYGSSTAPSYSDGDSVFEFFDDFDGSSLDTSKWVGRGTPTVQNSKVTIDATNEDIYSISSYGFGYILEAYADISSSVYGSLGFHNSDYLSSYYFNIFQEDYPNAGLNSRSYDSSTGNGENYALGTYTGFHILRIDRIDSNNVQYYVDDTFVATHTVNPTQSLPVLVSRSDSASSSGSVVVDWVFVRKYSSTEPTIQYGSEESGSWTIEGHTYTKRKKVTITSSENLQEFQVALDYSQFNDDKVYIAEFEIELNQTITP